METSSKICPGFRAGKARERSIDISFPPNQINPAKMAAVLAYACKRYDPSDKIKKLDEKVMTFEDDTPIQNFQNSFLLKYSYFSCDELIQ